MGYIHLIGFLNGFPPPSGTGVGSGFRFNPPATAGHRLFEGAIMIGVDSVRVSNAARNETQIFDADFLYRANIDSSGSVGLMRVLETAYAA